MAKHGPIVSAPVTMAWHVVRLQMASREVLQHGVGQGASYKMLDRTLDMERILKQSEENCLMRRIMSCTSETGRRNHGE